MKSVLMFVFILSLGAAIFLGFENFIDQKPKTVTESPFQKNSLAEQVFLDFSELKKTKQLPPQIFDVSGFFVTDRRSDKSLRLNIDIISALKLITPPRGDGLFEIELTIFDTAQDVQSDKESGKNKNRDPKAKKEQASKPDSISSEKTQLVFQFSIIEKKTKNKVAEIGRTYSVK